MPLPGRPDTDWNRSQDRALLSERERGRVQPSFAALRLRALRLQRGRSHSGQHDLQEADLGEIDEWILNKVAEDSAKYFTKAKTREQLAEIYDWPEEWYWRLIVGMHSVEIYYYFCCFGPSSKG